MPQNLDVGVLNFLIVQSDHTNTIFDFGKILGSETFIRWLVGMVVGSRGAEGISFLRLSKSQTAGLWRRFKTSHNEVNFEAIFDDH